MFSRFTRLLLGIAVTGSLLAPRVSQAVAPRTHFDANTTRLWKLHLPGEPFVPTRFRDLVRLIRPLRSACEPQATEVLDQLETYVTGEGTIAHPFALERIANILLDEEQRPRSCFREGFAAFALGSVFAMDPRNYDAEKTHDGGMPGPTRSAGVGLTLIAAGLLERGQLLPSGVDSQGRLIRPRTRDGTVVLGGYDCTLRSFRLDPLSPPFDFGAAFIHEAAHRFLEYSEFGLGKDLNQDMTSWDALLASIVVDETQASLIATYAQRHLRIRPGWLPGKPYEGQKGLSFVHRDRTTDRIFDHPGDDSLTATLSDLSADSIPFFLLRPTGDPLPGLGTTYLERNQVLHAYYARVIRSYFPTMYLNDFNFDLISRRAQLIKTGSRLIPLIDEPTLNELPSGPIPTEQSWIESSGSHAAQKIDFARVLRGLSDLLSSEAGSPYCTHFNKAVAEGQLKDYIGSENLFPDGPVKPGNGGVKGALQACVPLTD